MLATPRWTIQTSGVTARLRGVSAVSERVAWASGSGSTVLRTVDGGQTWQKLHVTDDAVDFRDIDAIDADSAYILTTGTPQVSPAVNLTLANVFVGGPMKCMDVWFPYTDTGESRNSNLFYDRQQALYVSTFELKSLSGGAQ